MDVQPPYLKLGKKLCKNLPKFDGKKVFKVVGFINYGDVLHIKMIASCC